MNIITEDTGVTIGLVIAIMGGVVWLTRVHFIGTTNRNAIEAQANQLADLKKESSLVLDRIARIETKLDILLDQLKK